MEQEEKQIRMERSYLYEMNHWRSPNDAYPAHSRPPLHHPNKRVERSQRRAETEGVIEMEAIAGGI